MTPRGIRNHNPGNIRISGDNWVGLASEQRDRSFFTFSAPEFGIRALVKILLTYRRRYGLNTVRKIIGRWAPPNENDTGSYVRQVSMKIGSHPDATIDLDDYHVMSALVEAIIHHENGTQPYGSDVIREGLRLAGIVEQDGRATA